MVGYLQYDQLCLYDYRILISMELQLVMITNNLKKETAQFHITSRGTFVRIHVLQTCPKILNKFV